MPSVRRLFIFAQTSTGTVIET